MPLNFKQVTQAAANNSAEPQAWLQNAASELAAGRYAEAAHWANMVPNGTYEAQRNQILSQIASQQGGALETQRQAPFNEAIGQIDVVEKADREKMKGEQEGYLNSLLGRIAGQNLGFSYMNKGAGTSSFNKLVGGLGDAQASLFAGYDAMRNSLKSRSLGEDLSQYNWYDQMTDMKKRYEASEADALDYIAAGVGGVKNVAAAFAGGK